MTDRNAEEITNSNMDAHVMPTGALNPTYNFKPGVFCLIPLCYIRELC